MEWWEGGVGGGIRRAVSGKWTIAKSHKFGLCNQWVARARDKLLVEESSERAKAKYCHTAIYCFSLLLANDDDEEEEEASAAAAAAPPVINR